MEKLKLVSFPDPVLRKNCRPIEHFDDELEQLARRMFEIMHAHKGVGLAGPQVGVPYRIFVWNPTGEPDNDQAFINPVLRNLDGQEQVEEGCLSLEAVTVNVSRARSAEVVARLPDGTQVRCQGEGLWPRIWQHEIDHLNGRLIIDYQSSSEELANRRAIKELESRYRQAHKTGKSAGRRKSRSR